MATHDIADPRFWDTDNDELFCTSQDNDDTESNNSEGIARPNVRVRGTGDHDSGNNNSSS